MRPVRDVAAGRPPAHAPDRRAADPLRLRAVPGDAGRRGRDCGRPGSAPRSLDGFDLDDELWAAFAVPIGLAFFLRSAASGEVVALYPSPAGATESSSSSGPGTTSSAATRCCGRSRPTSRCWSSTGWCRRRGRRSCPSTAATSWSAPSRRPGRASRAAPRSRTPSTRLLRRPAAAGSAVTPADEPQTALSRSAPSRTIAPDFQVVGCSVAEDAAAPALRFALEVTETSGREIYTIALTAQINVDPARRTYDADARARLVDLFGTPERWPATTHSFLWAQRDDARARASPAPRRARCRCRAATTSSWRRRSTSPRCRTARCRSASTSPARSSPRRRRPRPGGAGAVACSAQWPLPVATWREMMAARTRTAAARGCTPTRWTRLAGAAVRARPAVARRVRRRAARVRRRPRDATARGARPSLLYEGYALYPYTPGATKNATPTPFGIVYPPAYAAAVPSAHDHLRLRGVARSRDRPRWRPSVRFLQAAGEARTRRPSAALELGRCRRPAAAAHATALRRGPRAGRMRLRAEPAGEGLARVRCCVHNETALVPDGRRPRRGAARSPALHARRCCASAAAASSRRSSATGTRRGPAARASTPCRCSPPTRTTCCSAPPMVLPDHPQLAPESRGDLFDGTEIEEALLLHVLALSDAEREEIAGAGSRRAGDGRAGLGGDAGRSGRLHGRMMRAIHRSKGGRDEDRSAARRDPRRAGGVVDGVDVPARRQGAAAARRTRRPLRPDARRPHRRRSSASTSTTTSGCTSASRWTTTPGRS